MTNPTDDPSSPAADEAVMAEWQRIEAARIAEDLEEARDDAQTGPHPLRTWAWLPSAWRWWRGSWRPSCFRLWSAFWRFCSPTTWCTWRSVGGD